MQRRSLCKQRLRGGAAAGFASASEVWAGAGSGKACAPGIALAAELDKDLDEDIATMLKTLETAVLGMMAKYPRVISREKKL